MVLSDLDREILKVLHKSAGTFLTPEFIIKDGNNMPNDKVNVEARLELMQDKGLVEIKLEKSLEHYFAARITEKGLELIENPPSVEEGRKTLLSKFYQKWYLDEYGRYTIDELNTITGLPSVMIGKVLNEWRNNLLTCTSYENEEHWSISPEGRIEYENKYGNMTQLNKIENKNLLIKHKFQNVFYQKLVDEINISYHYSLILAPSILLRKLFENLLIDLLREQFKTSKLELYFNIKKKSLSRFFKAYL